MGKKPPVNVNAVREEDHQLRTTAWAGHRAEEVSKVSKEARLPRGGGEAEGVTWPQNSLLVESCSLSLTLPLLFSLFLPLPSLPLPLSLSLPSFSLLPGSLCPFPSLPLPPSLCLTLSSLTPCSILPSSPRPIPLLPPTPPWFCRMYFRLLPGLSSFNTGNISPLVIKCLTRLNEPMSLKYTQGQKTELRCIQTWKQSKKIIFL